MDQVKMRQFIEESALRECIDLSEIPDMEFYMEQVTKFMDNKLEPTKRNQEDKILTKTMINNYTKAGILMPPVKKKYSKDHIILMLLVYQLKQVLSLEDIKTLFTKILGDMTTTEDDLVSLEDIYSMFNDLKKSGFTTVEDLIEGHIEAIKERTKDIEDDESKRQSELFLLVISMIAEANALKRLSEKIIDTMF
ncbi:MAG: DUF1836 domain-containing protein [Tissierellales bacterium]|nr:DUF1836 domain-containing protein [Tissierellales bacterium]